MPWGDGIDRRRCFSLSDFHEFDYCPFRFFVKHNLEKKYELEQGSEVATLGNLLDLSIKAFHKSKAYGVETSYLGNIVKSAAREIREKVAVQGGKNSFYSASIPFLKEALIDRATQIFQNYYQRLNGQIKRSLGEVGFCEYVIQGEDGKWKLWGGADAYELGDDGIVEVCDYKYKEKDKGLDSLDMNLMPKIYILLASKFLLSKGYKQARFVVRFWNDPGNNSFYEEFSLTSADNLADYFKQRIQKILSVTQLTFCERDFCSACQNSKRSEYIKELLQDGFRLINENYIVA